MPVRDRRIFVILLTRWVKIDSHLLSSELGIVTLVTSIVLRSEAAVAERSLAALGPLGCIRLWSLLGSAGMLTSWRGAAGGGWWLLIVGLTVELEGIMSTSLNSSVDSVSPSASGSESLIATPKSRITALSFLAARRLTFARASLVAKMLAGYPYVPFGLRRSAIDDT